MNPRVAGLMAAAIAVIFVAALPRLFDGGKAAERIKPIRFASSEERAGPREERKQAPHREHDKQRSSKHREIPDLAPAAPAPSAAAPVQPPTGADDVGGGSDDGGDQGEGGSNSTPSPEPAPSPSATLLPPPSPPDDDDDRVGDHADGGTAD